MNISVLVRQKKVFEFYLEELYDQTPLCPLSIFFTQDAIKLFTTRINSQQKLNIRSNVIKRVKKIKSLASRRRTSRR